MLIHSFKHHEKIYRAGFPAEDSLTSLYHCLYSCEQTQILFFFIVSAEVPNTEPRLSSSFQFLKHTRGLSWKAWHVYCFSFFPSKTTVRNDYTQPCVTQQLHHQVLHRVIIFPSNSLCHFAPSAFYQLLQPVPQRGRLHAGAALQRMLSAVNSTANNISAMAFPALSSPVILW